MAFAGAEAETLGEGESETPLFLMAWSTVRQTAHSVGARQ